MKQITEREVRDLLIPEDTPPPEGLADLIKSEIPDRLDLRPAPEPRRPSKAAPFFRRPHPRTYALAASLVVTVGAAFLVYRVQRAGMAPEVYSSPAVADTAEHVLPAEAVRSTGAPDTVPDPDSAVSRDDMADQLKALGYLDGVASTADRPEAKRSEDRRIATASAGAGGEREGRVAGDVEAPPPPVSPSIPSGSRRAAREASPPPPAPRAQGDPVSQEKERLNRRRQSLSEELVARQLQVREEEADEATVLVESPRSSFRASSLKRPVAPPQAPSNPNAAPFDDVYFRDYGTNPFIDTEDDALSTFGLDVDTASYAVVRRFLNDGHLPGPEAVRVEELLNYFDYGDAAPKRGDFAIHAEGAPAPFGESERYHLVRFHLRGRELSEIDRRPADLTFVVDVSGSMARQDRLGLVRESLSLLTDQLRPDDRIALVVYGSRGRVVLEHTADRGLIRSALATLQPEGSTNAEEGLRLAYGLAARARRPGTVSRVILCSDGVANVGNTSADAILAQVADLRSRGIELTTVGFGMGNYNDVLMEQLADRGNGRYAYVDTLDEARQLFVENLTGTLQTIAAEARAQVEFNPEIVSRYRLVGYENRDIADARFRDDAVDAGEIGAGHAVTVLYEIKVREPLRRRDEIATLRLRYGSVLSGQIVEVSRTVTGKDMAESWQASSAALRLTSLVAEFGEILKQSYWARGGDLNDVFRRAQAVAVEFPGDAEVAELVSLIGKAARYRR